MKLLGLAAWVAWCCASPVQAAVSQIGTFRFPVSVSGHAFQVPYDGNLDVGDAHPQVLRAVVIIHGSQRNCSEGFKTLKESATLAGLNNSTSLLVVPQLLVEEDIAAHGLPSDHLFWSNSGWKEGDRSLSTTAHPRPARISSFAVLDSILARICIRNPNLESIVIAGHSAGGQFVNRFAAGSPIPQALASQYGVQFSYVVANPSSYLYLNGERPVPGIPNAFAVPSDGSCAGYDDYKYGLQSRNTYMSAVSSAQIVAQYRQRSVTYLLGELDVDPADPELDTSCPAMKQGAYRLERGRNYGNHLVHFYGATNAITHSTAVVPGVGHDSYDMFTSLCGVARLFQIGGCPVALLDSEPQAPGLSGGRVWAAPNPFRDRTTIGYRVAAGREPVTLGVYDVRGRLVRRLEGAAPVGLTGAVVWDGRTDTGDELPPGVYFVRAQDRRTTSRVILLP